MAMEKKGLFVKNLHLRINMYFLFGFGLWPMDFKDRPAARTLYFIWSNLIYYYNMMYVVTQWIEAYFVIRTGDVDRILQNIGLTLLCSINLFRIAVVKGKLAKNMVDVIYRIENRVLASKDEAFIKIYKRHAFISQFITVFFLILGYWTSVTFYVIPVIDNKANADRYIADNITGKAPFKKMLPFSSWYPYDINIHYWPTFYSQIFTGFVIEGFVVYTDAFLFSLMIFIIGQMKILQHILKNFRQYSKANEKNNNLDDIVGPRCTIKSCIMFHKEIIQFVQELDEAMRWTMLLDFLSCSIQMSVLVFQIIMFSTVGVQTVHAIEFLISMLAQLFLFYYNANEIMLESMAIGNAISDSEWYNENEEIKKFMLMMIMRAQNPLTVSIGSFFPMSLDTAINILKATYSYGMLLRQSYMRRM